MDNEELKIYRKGDIIKIAGEVKELKYVSYVDGNGWSINSTRWDTDVAELASKITMFATDNTRYHFDYPPMIIEEPTDEEKALWIMSN